ncbi:MAG: prolyl oligopeptidase family serine peptidase [Gemmatimonadaceae bacterium]|nr:prolyl oligopeptidase family serine peptidase [Gemmatimonadaceae bacterium]
MPPLPVSPRHLALALALLPAAAVAQRPTTLSIDSLYAQPSLIGTAPRGMTWSPDGSRLAFLWNDDGTNFADVWMVQPTAGNPVRVTRLPRPDVPAGPDSSHARQRQLIASELDAGVSAMLWTPDGARLLYTFRGDLYLASPGGRPVQLTRSPAAESRATFVGRNGQLSWIAGGDVFSGTLAGDSLHDVSRLTSLARDGVSVERFAWSADGTRLAIVETDRRAIPQRGIPDYLGVETQMPMVRRNFPGEPSESRRIGIIAVGDTAVRWIDLGAAPLDIVFTVAWSPVAPTLLVDMSDVFVKDRRLLVVDAATGSVRPLMRETEPLNVSAEWWAGWSPDGARVLFTSDRDTDYHVYDVPVRGGAVRALTRGDWAVFGVDVTPRGLLVTGNRGRTEERQLFRVSFTGGEPVRVSLRSGTHTAVVSPDGRRAAVLFSSDTVPPDLYVTDLTAAAGSVTSERRITTSPRETFATFPRTAARYVTFPSRSDGVTLHGRLLLPRGWTPGTRLPVIVGSVYSNTVRNQWGGRNAHPLWGLDAVLLDRGYAVFAVDVAGSSGHGTTFRRRIRLDYGTVDVEDLHSGVEYLIREGIADSARIGLWGSSYGGLMTTMSLFTKPGVYAAGIAGAPATNVWHALTGEQRVMMRPQEQMAAYARASSHTKAAGLRDHLMIIHGMRDVVVLYKDSVWLTQYLMQMGRSVELLTLPDAQHGWDTEGLYQTRFAFTRMLEYFERHLGGKNP